MWVLLVGQHSNAGLVFLCLLLLRFWILQNWKWEWPENTQRFSVKGFMDLTEGLSWVLKKTCRLMVYDVPAVRSSPTLGRSWAKNPADLHLLGLWVVLNIINGIARGGSPCVRAPPSLAPEERMMCETQSGAPAKVVCAECMKMFSWGKEFRS